MRAQNFVAMPKDALAVLRGTLLKEGGPAAASFLQESGYAGGEALSAALSAWLEDEGYATLDRLDLDSFAEVLTRYFEEIGWGSLAVSQLNQAVAALDTPDWWESDPGAGLDHPGCHLSTGVLADLVERVAGAPMAVLEVECRSMGSERCRFLVGSAEALERVYESMLRGATYQEATEELLDRSDAG